MFHSFTKRFAYVIFFISSEALSSFQISLPDGDLSSESSRNLLSHLLNSDKHSVNVFDTLVCISARTSKYLSFKYYSAGF